MKALLADGLNLVRRIYAARAATQQPNQSNSGELMDAVIAASVASLQRALRQHRPSHCLVVLDSDGRNWRHELHPNYKSKRPPMPPPLRRGLEQFAQAVNALALKCFSLSGYEADDVIATTAVKIAQRNGQALILSTDRNYCQLLSPHIAVFDHFGQRYLDRDLIMQRFQVQPWQLPDLLALAGDSSASIPGVQSIGVRTAAKLLARHGSLEKLLTATTLPHKINAKLQRGKQDARLAKTLFTLKTDLSLGLNLSQLRCSHADAAANAAARQP